HRFASGVVAADDRDDGSGNSRRILRGAGRASLAAGSDTGGHIDRELPHDGCGVLPGTEDLRGQWRVQGRVARPDGRGESRPDAPGCSAILDAEEECWIRDFDPMQNAEEECGIRVEI